MPKVFLGGTCNNSTWRDDLIEFLEIDYFNPVVDDWTEECKTIELQERLSCDFCLYCITPKMTGVYSIAEVVDDSNKRPGSTILIVLESDDTSRKKFNKGQLRSLQAVAEMVEENGGKSFDNLKDAADYMNTEKSQEYESEMGLCKAGTSPPTPFCKPPRKEYVDQSKPKKLSEICEKYNFFWVWCNMDGERDKWELCTLGNNVFTNKLMIKFTIYDVTTYYEKRLHGKYPAIGIEKPMEYK